MHAGRSDLRIYDGSDLKTYLSMRGFGPGVFGQVHRNLTVRLLSFLYLDMNA